jgi:hypothetical protein
VEENKRAHPRVITSVAVQLHLDDDRLPRGYFSPVSARLTDLSVGGARLELTDAAPESDDLIKWLPPGQRVEIRSDEPLFRFGSIPLSVVWSSGRRLGLAFCSGISPRRKEALLHRGGASSDSEDALTRKRTSLWTAVTGGLLMIALAGSVLRARWGDLDRALASPRGVRVASVQREGLRLKGVLESNLPHEQRVAVRLQMGSQARSESCSTTVAVGPRGRAQFDCTPQRLPENPDAPISVQVDRLP